jgi:hypothetical protein
MSSQDIKAVANLLVSESLSYRKDNTDQRPSIEQPPIDLQKLDISPTTLSNPPEPVGPPRWVATNGHSATPESSSPADSRKSSSKCPSVAQLGRRFEPTAQSSSPKAFMAKSQSGSSSSLSPSSAKVPLTDNCRSKEQLKQNVMDVKDLNAHQDSIKKAAHNTSSSISLQNDANMKNNVYVDYVPHKSKNKAQNGNSEGEIARAFNQNTFEQSSSSNSHSFTSLSMTKSFASKSTPSLTYRLKDNPFISQELLKNANPKQQHPQKIKHFLSYENSKDSTNREKFQTTPSDGQIQNDTNLPSLSQRSDQLQTLKDNTKTQMDNINSSHTDAERNQINETKKNQQIDKDKTESAKALDVVRELSTSNASTQPPIPQVGPEKTTETYQRKLPRNDSSQILRSLIYSYSDERGGQLSNTSNVVEEKAKAINATQGDNMIQYFDQLIMEITSSKLSHINKKVKSSEALSQADTKVEEIAIAPNKVIPSKPALELKEGQDSAKSGIEGKDVSNQPSTTVLGDHQSAEKQPIIPNITITERRETKIPGETSVLYNSPASGSTLSPNTMSRETSPHKHKKCSPLMELTSLLMDLELEMLGYLNDVENSVLEKQEDKQSTETIEESKRTQSNHSQPMPTSSIDKRDSSTLPSHELPKSISYSAFGEVIDGYNYNRTFRELIVSPILEKMEILESSEDDCNDETHEYLYRKNIQEPKEDIGHKETFGKSTPSEGKVSHELPGPKEFEVERRFEGIKEADVEGSSHSFSSQNTKRSSNLVSLSTQSITSPAPSELNSPSDPAHALQLPIPQVVMEGVSENIDSDEHHASDIDADEADEIISFSHGTSYDSGELLVFNEPNSNLGSNSYLAHVNATEKEELLVSGLLSAVNLGLRKSRSHSDPVLLGDQEKNSLTEPRTLKLAPSLLPDVLVFEEELIAQYSDESAQTSAKSSNEQLKHSLSEGSNSDKELVYDSSESLRPSPY